MGVRSWHDVLSHRDRIPTAWRASLVEESERCLRALEKRDIRYFVDEFTPQDRWRVLAHFLDEVSFFDIETAGLEHDDPITLIICWHKGRLWTFVEHENLDDFLDLLDDIALLASFNGGSFDVPRVLDTFHIPSLPCPHLDLRWLCYHQGHRGGLKEITARLGMPRPSDLQGADGEWAIRLWSRWHHFEDRVAREQLIRYCAADVLLLVTLAQHLVGRETIPFEDLWSRLPRGAEQACTADNVNNISTLYHGAFGAGSPTRLRGRRQRMVG